MWLLDLAAVAAFGKQEAPFLSFSKILEAVRAQGQAQESQ